MKTVFIKKDGKIVREATIVVINPTHVIFEAEEGSGINTCVYYDDMLGKSDWSKENGFNAKTSGYQIHVTKGIIDGFELNYDFIVQAGVSTAIDDGVGNEKPRVDNPSFSESENKGDILRGGCDILISLFNLLVKNGYDAEEIFNVAQSKLLQWYEKSKESRCKNQRYDVWFIGNTFVDKNENVNPDNFIISAEVSGAIKSAISELEEYDRVIVARSIPGTHCIVLITKPGRVRKSVISNMESSVQDYIVSNGNDLDIDEIERIATRIITEK